MFLHVIESFLDVRIDNIESFLYLRIDNIDMSNPFCSRINLNFDNIEKPSLTRSIISTVFANARTMPKPHRWPISKIYTPYK